MHDQVKMVLYETILLAYTERVLKYGKAIARICSKSPDGEVMCHIGNDLQGI
jgi:hypothetical protein